ncbi:MAG: CoA pyrophosphatase [Thermoleophilaceae bacterium]|nr:CoA pyrophosphatase [Thermoleophilaceae bacterium]
MTSAADLRPLLLSPEDAAAVEAPFAGDKDAAVLVPLYLDSGALHAVFTKRRDDLSKHPGEISFPGGRPDFPEETMQATALREAEEEIGLAAADIELVGALEPMGTFVTGYTIYPFVGVIASGHAWVPQPTEVEIVLELSLPDLVRGYENRRLLGKGVPIKTPTYTVDGNLVWGATARIVQTLLRRLEPVLG